MPIIDTYNRRKLIGYSPYHVTVGSLECLRYCIECNHRYSPACKYCPLDGSCSRHGVPFKNGKCPICGRAFQEDWDEYLKVRTWY